MSKQQIGGSHRKDVTKPPLYRKTGGQNTVPNTAESRELSDPGRTQSSRFVLLTASACCALTVLDTNVVAVSLPSIAQTFHASFADVEWVVSSYMVVFASCLLAAGGLADRLGRKKTLLIGLVLFALASLGCGLAPSVFALNIARALKGVGAAVFLTSALAIIAHSFQAGPERVKAWAFWGTCMGLATTVAPLVGGAITQWISWRWVFLLNVPVCAILGVCVFFGIRDSRNPDAGRVDLIGSLLFGAGLSVCIWALISAPSDGWGSTKTLVRLGGGALLLTAFYCAERFQRSPMIDLALFRQPRFVAAVLSMFGYAACAQVMMTFLPLYLQNAFSLSAVQAGVGMLPFALAMIAGPYVGAVLGRRLSTHSVLSVGLALVGAGNLLTAMVASLNHYALVAIGMLITGLGAGALNGNTQKAIMACVPPSRTGMASGISTTTRFTGIVASVGILGAVLVSRTRASIDSRPSALLALKGVDQSTFLSRVLAGDLEHATATLSAPLRATLSNVARESFAVGFAWSLSVAGLLAIAVSMLAYVLSRRVGTIESDMHLGSVGTKKSIS